MTAQSGALMLLKIFVEEDNKYQTIGGLRTTRMLLNNQIIDVTNKESENWRELISGGIRSISISGGGVFTSSNTEQEVCKLSFSGKSQKYKIFLGNNEIIEGNFIITSYERNGDYQDEETYQITLESAGKITWNIN